jgi:Uma2 family endonuclease
LTGLIFGGLTNPIGYVTGADGSYILSATNRPIPDVGYISKGRLPELPLREDPIPPDLAVEVVSPTDDLREVQKKALRYLHYGVQLVWLVYPEDQTVDVYQPSDPSVEVQTYRMGEALCGAGVLPGFSLPLADIFTLAQ